MYLTLKNAAKVFRYLGIINERVLYLFEENNIIINCTMHLIQFLTAST